MDSPYQRFVIWRNIKIAKFDHYNNIENLQFTGITGKQCKQYLGYETADIWKKTSLQQRVEKIKSKDSKIYR